MIDFSSKHNVLIRNEDGTFSRMDEPYFKSWKLDEGTWRILSSGDYSYLLEAEEEALAIDSGYGAGNIREYMQTLTDKPVRRIANTHDHFDHTANNSYFEEAFMSEACVPLATRPFPSFAGILFPKDYPITVLKDMDYIPLKGRELQAISIPDHAVSSMAFLDEKHRILFSGDEFMMGRKMLHGGVAHWKNCMEKLMSVRDKFDIMYGGAFTTDASVVDKMLICAENALKTGGQPMGEGPGGKKGPKMGGPEFSADGMIIYDRMAPHPEDRGPMGGGKRENMRKSVYEDVEIVFDIEKLYE